MGLIKHMACAFLCEKVSRHRQGCDHMSYLYSSRIDIVLSSLMNMYKELKADIPEFDTPKHGTLTGWAKQGVLLLNACLTVEKGKANSHKGKGWEKLTVDIHLTRFESIALLFCATRNEH
jgi:uracil DNA glycosylase